MDPATWAAIAAVAAGVLKSASEQSNYRKDLKMEADMAPWSPYSGRQTRMPSQPDSLGTLMQSGITAAQLMNRPEKTADSPQTTGITTTAPMAPTQQFSFNPYDRRTRGKV